ncbi:uracil-DNA glycosylase family protein [Pseudoalteromonas sp. MMG022]|uniref:uracil-DNA glycosylase family protein n=1 Tax=Pseudoalteromonas sp. MMG022 TaxID=2909978 RepID=UPI001F45E1C4|nr:uracil-DNA glycosylase family protein [Pseudoalteromonas sp. MMG022]MCF6434497.1 uracil-DNA glycosylase family protein [Pseudoalteromonas sp. MMG022]
MQIVEQIRSCTLCAKTLPQGANPVVQASSKAKVLIAGQAPSLTVHKTGKLFNDASGKRLRSWLNVTEEQFYDPELFAIVPMAFCYPGRGNSGDLPPPAICAKTWHHALLAKLTNVNLTIIIGQYAQRYHLDASSGLTEQVQNWQALLPKRIVLPHPSPRNQAWLKRHDWFEQQVIPALQARVKILL